VLHADAKIKRLASGSAAAAALSGQSLRERERRLKQARIWSGHIDPAARLAYIQPVDATGDSQFYIL